MIVPEVFNIGPFKVSTVFKTNMWEKDDKVGMADIGNQKIILQPPMPGILNKKCCEQTFLHELFHMLFFYAGQRELYVDEVLVDVMASLLYQVLETKRGNALAKHKRQHNARTCKQ
jgi:hypothetical protein